VTIQVQLRDRPARGGRGAATAGVIEDKRIGRQMI